MKLEINVPVEDSMVGGTVEKVLVRVGDVVEGGANLCLVRRKG